MMVASGLATFGLMSFLGSGRSLVGFRIPVIFAVFAGVAMFIPMLIAAGLIIRRSISDVGITKFSAVLITTSVSLALAAFLFWLAGGLDSMFGPESQRRARDHQVFGELFATILLAGVALGAPLAGLIIRRQTER
jgi:hypothetical protein